MELIQKHEEGADYLNLKKLAIDKEAFERYWKLKSHPVLTERRFFRDSTNSDIDLAYLPNYLKKIIQHLPQEEQTKIMSLKKMYNDVLLKLGKEKSSAFGRTPNPNNMNYTNFQIIAHKKEEVLELFGRMFSVDEVHKIITGDWQIPITLRMLHRFRVYYASTIEEKIRIHQTKYSDLRLGVKRSRLEELTYLYQTLKEKYRKSLSREDHKVLLQNLEQIRKEVEGDTLRIEGNLDLNIESSVNLHLQKEVFKDLSLNQIILARIAARLSMPAMELVRSLAESYYSKFSGIIIKPQTEENTEFQLPSLIPYDFDKIRSVKEAEKRNEQVLKQQEASKPVQPTIEQSTLSFKERLIQKLRQQNEQVQAQTSEIVKTNIIDEGTKGIQHEIQKERKIKYLHKQVDKVKNKKKNGKKDK